MGFVNVRQMSRQSVKVVVGNMTKDLVTRGEVLEGVLVAVINGVREW